MNKVIKTIFLCGVLMIMGTVAACGVKPKKLSPPEGAEDSTFPRTYPDTQYDPKPEEQNK